MHFCADCGVLLTPDGDNDRCSNCDPMNGAPILSREANTHGTTLEGLTSTKSGHILKRDAVEWLSDLDRPTPKELKRAMLPKPAGFEGRTHETDISNIRFTGDARFIETIAGVLSPILDLENDETRVEIKLQRTKSRDTEQYTGNYALYLSVAERSGT